MLRDRLVKLRKEKNKTQADMAHLLGITRPAYTAYEKGNRNPDYETLAKLADFFDCTVDYLLGRSDDPNSHREDPDFPEMDPSPREESGKERYFLYEGSDEKFTREEIEAAEVYIKLLRERRKQRKDEDDK